MVSSSHVATVTAPMSAGDTYEISDDPARIDRDKAWAYLSTEAYWGRSRSRADFDHQMDIAWRVVGAYASDGSMAGFCRALSDGVGLAYIADVVVFEEHRGNGLGKRLVGAMIDEGPGAGFRWLLHTDDAHGLYEQFGFGPPDPTVLQRPARD